MIMYFGLMCLELAVKKKDPDRAYMCKCQKKSKQDCCIL